MSDEGYKPDEQEIRSVEGSLTVEQEKASYNREKVLADIEIEANKAGLSESEVEELIDSLGYLGGSDAGYKAHYTFNIKGKKISVAIYKDVHSVNDIYNLSVDGWVVGEEVSQRVFDRYGKLFSAIGKLSPSEEVSVKSVKKEASQYKEHKRDIENKQREMMGEMKLSKDIEHLLG